MAQRDGALPDRSLGSLVEGLSGVVSRSWQDKIGPERAGLERARQGFMDFSQWPGSGNQMEPLSLFPSLSPHPKPCSCLFPCNIRCLCGVMASSALHCPPMTMLSLRTPETS